MNILTSSDLGGIKISLVFPPLNSSVLYDEWDLSAVDSVSPPLGLLSLAAMVRQYGGEPRVIDAYARKLPMDEAVEKALEGEPDVIGVSCMSPSYPSAKVLIKRLKERAPGIPLVLGGAHMSALPGSVMEDLPELDIGVINEGEITIIDLLNAIQNNSDLMKVNGIIFRRNGEIVRTAPREFIPDLDIIPLPAWDLVSPLSKDYRLSVVGTKSEKSTSLLTSRGCPAECSFCDVGGVGRKIRGFSSGYVINMIDHLRTEYGITDFLIYDDTFVALKRRLKEICEEIIRRKWDIHWSCCARVDMVNKDSLKLMRDAGCWQIEYGIESGSPEILELMKKKIKLERVEEAVRWTKEAGIETRGNFIFGYLGETRQTLEQSLDFALKLDLDFFQQTFLTPYPGSEVYDLAEQYGDVNKDLEKMNNMSINFVPAGLTTDELQSFSAKAFRRFYLRPRVVFYQLHNLKSLSGIKRLAVSFWAFVKTVMYRKSS